MIPYSTASAVFWSNFVEQAYANFTPSNPNPQPPTFPAGWSFVANLQVDLRVLGTYYFIGFVLRGPGGRTAIVFLGTEDLEWLYDGDALQTPHPLGGAVESGMYDMYGSLILSTPGSSVTTPFKSFLAQLDTTLPIGITGHSLGGALTTLTAADIALLPKPPTAANLEVYSLASPRIGTDAFATAFNQAVINNYRIYNVRDYVPCLPPEDLGFAHVNTALPQPEPDSWSYPIYHGWDPVKAAECYHSHAGYNYMLKVLDGLTPDAASLLGSCYAPKTPKGSVVLAHSSQQAQGSPASS